MKRILLASLLSLSFLNANSDIFVIGGLGFGALNIEPKGDGDTKALNAFGDKNYISPLYSIGVGFINRYGRSFVSFEKIGSKSENAKARKKIIKAAPITRDIIDYGVEIKDAPTYILYNQDFYLKSLNSKDGMEPYIGASLGFSSHKIESLYTFRRNYYKIPGLGLPHIVDTSSPSGSKKQTIKGFVFGLRAGAEWKLNNNSSIIYNFSILKDSAKGDAIKVVRKALGVTTPVTTKIYDVASNYLIKNSVLLSYSF